MKRLQNRIAEGGLTLPLAAVFAIVVCLYGGLVTQRLWPQFACFAVSVYLFIELTNQNALLRVRSRMVSSTFIMLSCTASFLFPSMTGALVQMFLIGSLLFLFQTYQDPLAVGHTFYAFVGIGLASLAFVQTLWYVPLLWVLMATQLQVYGWRVLTASLLGLLTPAWLIMSWLIFKGDLSMATEWIDELTTFSLPFVENGLNLLQIAVLVFVAVSGIVGIIHFWYKSFEDKTRVRLLYGFLTATAVGVVLGMLIGFKLRRDQLDAADELIRQIQELKETE